MRRLALVITMTVLALAHASPDRPPRRIPPDFTVEYQRGPTAADSGDATYVRLEPGRGARWVFTMGRIVRAPGGAGAGRTVDRRVVVSATAVRPVLAAVIRHRFFDLDPQYDDPSVHDGSTSSVTVTLNGQRHQVVVRMTDEPRYRRVVGALIAVPPQPTRP